VDRERHQHAVVVSDTCIGQTGDVDGCKLESNDFRIFQDTSLELKKVGRNRKTMPFGGFVVDFLLNI